MNVLLQMKIEESKKEFNDPKNILSQSIKRGDAV